MNKQLLLTLSLIVTTICAYANFNGSGYYRVQNTFTERTAFLIDNHAKINAGATNVDMRAIELWSNPEKPLSDPASVLYISDEGGSNYDIQAQGSGVHSMTGEYIHLLHLGDGKYRCYGRAQGVVLYIGDDNQYKEDEQSYMSTSAKEYCLDWYIKPISSTGDNFMSVKSTVSADGTHFASFYASFPFATIPSGMKVCYITSVDKKRGYAVYEEHANGKINGSVPVLVKCVSPNYAENKIEVGATGTSTPQGNLLKGAFFSNDKPNHVSYTANTAQMRHLGLTSDGHLGMITISDKMVPRNTAYLVVDADCPAQLRLVSKAQYNDILAAEVPVESVTLNAEELTLQLGQTSTLVATIHPSNATYQQTKWYTSNAEIVPVDNGKITALSCGIAYITANCEGQKATCKVTVTKKSQTITWNQDFSNACAGDVISLNATSSTGKPVTYTLTTGSSIAEIKDGKLSISLPGQISIKATVDGDDQYQSAEMTKTFTAGINPERVNVAFETSQISVTIGESTTVKAVATPQYAANLPITYSSENPAIATVDNNGVVKALKAGTTNITATCSGKVAKCQVTVLKKTQTISWDIDLSNVRVGDAIALNATASTGLPITYSLPAGSALSEIIDGTLHIWKTGEITIKAYQEGNDEYAPAEVLKSFVADKKLQSIVWDQDFRNVEIGQTITLNASATSGLDIRYTLDKGSEYATLNQNKLTINAEGEFVVTAHQDGSDRVEPAESVTKSFSVVINLDNVAISLNHAFISLRIDETAQLNVAITPDYAAYLPVEWTSSNENIATVDANGLVEAKGAGNAIITATCAGKTASAEISVSKKLQEIVWVQPTLDMIVDEPIELTAYSTSGLEVAYEILSGDATIAGNMLTVHEAGTITIKATQGGDATFEAASSVTKTFNATLNIAEAMAQGVAIRGTSIINNGRQQVIVAKTSGIVVYQGNDAVITLNPGYYIISTPDSTFKAHLK